MKTNSVSKQVTAVGNRGSVLLGNLREVLWNMPECPSEGQGSCDIYPPSPVGHWFSLALCVLTAQHSGLSHLWAEGIAFAYSKKASECQWDMRRSLISSTALCLRAKPVYGGRGCEGR